VSVWREVRRSGALQLQKSVVAFPDTEEFRTALARVRAAVSAVEGTALVMRAEPLEGDDEAALIAAWNEAREAEYTELASECDKLVAEIDKEFAKEKFTLAELDEEEAELEKLASWHARIRARDVHGSDGAGEAEAALGRVHRGCTGARCIINVEAALRAATAIFLRFPIEATNSGTCG